LTGPLAAGGAVDGGRLGYSGIAPKKYPTAYPISTFTYCIVPHGAPKKSELEQFIKYALTTGQKYGAALDFAPMPKIVVKSANNTLAAL
jgi:ABC-type phosphate transport system substrate-binding protein